mgnify:CR=1 FL=1
MQLDNFYFMAPFLYKRYLSLALVSLLTFFAAPPILALEQATCIQKYVVTLIDKLDQKSHNGFSGF